MIYFLKKLFHMKGIAYRYDQLFDEARRLRPLNIMEVGVWTGERARKIISIAKEYHPAPSINYYGFDLFEPMDPETYSREVSKQPPSLEEVETKLGATGVGIHLIKGNTLVTMPRVVEKLPEMDLVFIDGGHSLETVENDWTYTQKNSGLVVWSYLMTTGLTVPMLEQGRQLIPSIEAFTTWNFFQ